MGIVLFQVLLQAESEMRDFPFHPLAQECFAGLQSQDFLAEGAPEKTVEEGIDQAFLGGGGWWWAPIVPSVARLCVPFF